MSEAGQPITRIGRIFRLLRPSHRHSAFTATIVLMTSAMLSRVIGLVRVKYIAYLFGRGTEADALNAAFVLPDMISYFLVGGAASITFVTILSRYHDEGRDEDGQRSLSIILTTMFLVLGAAILLAELAAPYYIHWWFPGFDATKAALCTHLTRILLPAQLCFFAGGVSGAVLLVRKQFNVQAVSPLIYNLGTIVGGVLLARTMGVSALAIGTVAGAVLGPFLLNYAGAVRAGFRYRPKLDWQDAGLREWVRLSIPLMIGFSLVTVDNWIIAYFASHSAGTISLMNYAKNFFNAPVALGQAAGAASLPFLASLYSKRNDYEYSKAVDASVSRIVAFSLLLSAWMIPLGGPALDLVLRGGAFRVADASQLAGYFAIFSMSLCFWSAQAIYARAFYAAGDTKTAMIAGSIVTLVCLPLYKILFDHWGATGLAIASDIGITMQTLTLAILLHTRRMVSLAMLEYVEIGRSLLAALLSGGAIVLLAQQVQATTRIEDAGLLAAGTVLWLCVALLVLFATGSKLPDQLAERFRR
jgi:putative peptidoglycan lipid II flippase